MNVFVTGALKTPSFEEPTAKLRPVLTRRPRVSCDIL